MATMGHCSVGDLPGLMLTQMVMVVGGQWAELKECRVWDSCLAGWHYCQPAVRCVPGWKASCAHAASCACAPGQWMAESTTVLLLASWMACPWMLGWRLFSIHFFEFFSLACRVRLLKLFSLLSPGIFWGLRLLLNTQCYLTILLL